MTAVWRTEYAAEGAKVSKKQFEEFVELSNFVAIFARKNGTKERGDRGRR